MIMDKSYFKKNVYFEFLGKYEDKEDRFIYHVNNIPVGFRVFMSGDETEIASLKVTTKMAEYYGILEKDLIDLCYKNTKELFGVEKLDFHGFGFVLTNRNGFKGAILITDPSVIEDLNIKGNKIAVIPSSVHEVILIPFETKEDLYQFDQMVKDVNKMRDCISKEEILMDTIFIFDGEKFVMDWEDYDVDSL